MTPDKRVEEIVTKVIGLIDLIGGEATVSIDFQDGEEPVEFILQEKVAEELRKALTQYHQDLMSEVVEKIEQLPTQSGNDYGIAYKRAGDYKQEVLTIIKSK